MPSRSPAPIRFTRSATNSRRALADNISRRCRSLGDLARCGGVANSKDKTLNEIAGWVAPAATMLAAMMTAANLGARITGWGFVVFTVGSVCWATVGAATGQTNLLATNLFLTLVNFVGIWRWLGRQRAYEDGGKSARAASRRSAVPSLFTATGIAGMKVADAQGATVGKAVEALIECDSGAIGYVVVATGTIGGLDEKLRAVPRAALGFAGDRLDLRISLEAFEALVPLEAGDWPAAAPPVARSGATT
jgi:hypothetical protein